MLYWMLSCLSYCTLSSPRPLPNNICCNSNKSTQILKSYVNYLNQKSCQLWFIYIEYYFFYYYSCVHKGVKTTVTPKEYRPWRTQKNDKIQIMGKNRGRRILINPQSIQTIYGSQCSDRGCDIYSTSHNVNKRQYKSPQGFLFWLWQKLRDCF